MTMITKYVTDKLEELENEAYTEEGPKSYVKAFTAGFLEGLVDSCLISGAIVTVVGTVRLIKNHF